MSMRRGLRAALAVSILVALPLSGSAGAAVFDCDEAGVQLAVGTGGGPHTFSCAGPTTVTLTSVTLDVFASVILDGESLLTLSGGDAFRVFSVHGGATLELRNLVVTEGNGSFSDGGCILVSPGGSLVVTSCTVTDCHVAPGGGGAILSDGSVTITDSTISGNTAGFGGGAIYSGNTSAAASVSVSDIVGNSSAIGGGIVIQMGSLSLADTSVSGNTAEGAGGIAALGGPTVGALVITGSTISGNISTNPSVPSGGIRPGAASLTLRNSTLTGNTGGAISNFGGMLIENTTISGNTAAPATAIHHTFGQAGTETLRNSIVDGTCTAAPALRTSQGGNLESPGNTCNLTHASDQVNVSAGALHLGALGDYGGPTQTVPLLHPSAAIGAAVACPPPATDQRGVARPQAAGCDSGAYESEAAVPIDGLAWLAIALAAAGALALRSTPAAARTWS